MSDLKPTKTKIFLFFILVYFLSSILFLFLSLVVDRIWIFELQAKINVIHYLLDALNLFVVSYAMIAFLKKEFFLKKYFKELMEIFIILFVLSKLFAWVFRLIPISISPSALIQVPYFVLQIVIYYAVICFIAKENHQ